MQWQIKQNKQSFSFLLNWFFIKKERLGSGGYYTQNNNNNNKSRQSIFENATDLL